MGWRWGQHVVDVVRYNLTQSVSLNLQNANEPSAASFSMLENDEVLDSTFTVPYGDVMNGSFGNGTVSSPWDYVEYRLIWTQHEIKFYIGGHLARTLSEDDNKGLFSTPSPLYLRHWSNGNPRSSQGPPKEPTVANDGWLRAFFNSSSMTEDDHRNFDRKCREADACQSDDRALRGFSSYPQAAILEWKQIKKTRPKGWPEIAIAIACISLTALLLLSPIWKRMRDRLDKRTKPKTRGRRRLGTSNFRQQLFL